VSKIGPLVNVAFLLSFLKALLNRHHHMELVVTVLVSVHQEFPASLEVLDLPDQQDHLVIMDLKDPWAQEETGEIKALKEVKVLRDQPVQLETRVTRGPVEVKVPQVPRELLGHWDVTGNNAFLRT